MLFMELFGNMVRRVGERIARATRALMLIEYLDSRPLSHISVPSNSLPSRPKDLFELKRDLGEYDSHLKREYRALVEVASQNNQDISSLDDPLSKYTGALDTRKANNLARCLTETLNDERLTGNSRINSISDYANRLSALNSDGRYSELIARASAITGNAYSTPQLVSA